MNTRISALFSALIFSSSLALAAAPDECVFSTPDDAVKALTAALKSNDESALVQIFGERNKDLVITSDKAAALESRQQALKSIETSLFQRQDSDNKITLVMGANAWPMPIPLVKDSAGWHFDSEQGATELINRRIGDSELAAIEVLRAYPAAQRQFAASARDASKVRSFARNILSSPGKKDGLYWESDASKNEQASPFGPLIADGASRNAGDPYHGYYFKILTAQGAKAPGGKYSYLINGRLLAGFAMIAWPADYASSGVKTFIVNHYGDVYEKDLGANTAKIAKGINEYNPDASWNQVSD
ncbi:DUF2950 domain-containing protein [Undibacterium sp. Ren11W]|uniref:DUF2950 domain-containing protein n=1 Tax=Undibacterium sp. Ren11W TaxID=3413045 RepID=UPI003BF02E7A